MRVFGLTVDAFFDLTPAMWHLLLRGEARRAKGSKRQPPAQRVATYDQLPEGAL